MTAMSADNGSGTRATTTQWFTPLQMAVVTALLLFAAFPQVLLGTRSFFFRDYGVLGYPFIHHARESFWRGELPLWNSLSNCGAPFLAQWGTMTLYPFSLIYLLLPLPWGLSVFWFVHLVWGAVGMHRLAQRWTRDPCSASVGGAAYVFSGFTFACLIWPNYAVALGWMPWVVWAAERAWTEGGTAVLVAALAATMQMLSGVPEIVMLTWLVVGTMWVGEMVVPGEGAALARGRSALRLGMVILLTAGLSAAQLLPFFDLLAHSQRELGALPAKWAMPAWGWANLLVPLFHCFETPQGQFFQYGQEFLSSYYLGAGPLVLAAWALCRVREGRVWALAALFLFGLVMALGEQTPLYGWFKAVVPVAGLARYPVKFVALAAFVVPLLAAYGVAQWSEAAREGKRSKTLWIVGGLTLALMAALIVAAWEFPLRYDQPDVTAWNTLGRAGFLVLALALLWAAVWGRDRSEWVPRLAGLGLVATFALDAATHSPRQNPSLPARVFKPGLWSQAVELAPPRFGESRLMISPAAEQGLLHSSVKDAEQNFLGKRLAEWSNLNVLDGIPKVNGASTLQLREQMQVQSLLYATTNRLLEGLMDFLGVSRFTKPGTVVEWTARTNFLPLVTAGQRAVFVEGTNALAALAAPEFDPREVVFLPREAAGAVTATNRTRARVVPGAFTAHRLEFVVEAEAPALVVVAQSFYHPWEAEVEGRPVPMWRANHAFQALEVPAGRSRVVVRYRDRNFRAGAAVSGATLLGCALFWLRRRTAGPAPPM